MKRTIREYYIGCKNCNATGHISMNNEGDSYICKVCEGNGRKLIKEIIEESDDMKEFVEKKLGWELCETSSDFKKSNYEPLTYKFLEKMWEAYHGDGTA